MRASLCNLLRSAVRGPLLVISLLAFDAPIQAGPKSRSPAVRLRAPDKLSAATRAEVRGRMGRHGNTMSNLVRAVVLLDRPTITNLAGRIADEEVVSRTEGGETDQLKLLLPTEFFAEASALQSSAHDLAASSANKDSDGVMADRFAAIAKTCVACHSVYLHGPSGSAR